MVTLDDVRAARVLGDSTRAVTLALNVWHETKHPAVADAVDRLSEEALKTFSAPTVRQKSGFHKAWLEVAKERDDVATGWLAKTLVERVEVSSDNLSILRPDYTQTKYQAFFERLAALERRVADPRIAGALCALLEEPRFVVWDARRTRPLYAPVAALLAAQGDVRVMRRLEALAIAPRASKALLRDVIAELIPPLITALKGVEVKALPDEDEWYALAPTTNPAEVAPPGRSEADLLEAIYAAPDDVGLRSVYADALLERADPRGEFISLQLVETPSAAQHKRIKALLKAHRAEWLGPLANVLKGPTFVRGFLHSAALEQNAVATPEAWAAAAVDERLATVVDLQPGRGSTEHLVQFLKGGALRNLKRCVLPTFEALDVLSKPPLSRCVEHLELPKRGAVKFLKPLGAMSLESLRTLRLSFDSKYAAEWRRSLELSGLLRRVVDIELTPRRGSDEEFLVAALNEWWSLPVKTLSFLGPYLGYPLLKVARRSSPSGGEKRFRVWLAHSSEAVIRKAVSRLVGDDVEFVVFGDRATLADLC